MWEIVSVGCILVGCGDDGGSGSSDSTAPVVITSSPTPGAVNVGTTLPITITFSEPMADDSVSADSIRVGSAAGTLMLAGNIVTFTPASPLESESVQLVTVTQSARDLAGNALATEYGFSFTTGTAPTAISSSPASAANDVPTVSTISVTFSDAMLPSSFTGDRLSVSSDGAIAGTTAVSGTTATFTAAAALPSEATITVTVNRLVTNLGGSALAADHVFSFVTRDGLPPMVIATSPANTATGVAVTGDVTATFSEPMLQSSIDGTSFTLRETTTSSPIPGTVTTTSTTATFTPAADLVNNTGYTAAVTTAVTDVAGNALAATYEFTFTTEP